MRTREFGERRVRRVPQACSATRARRSSRGARTSRSSRAGASAAARVVNSAIAYRTPEDVLDEWARALRARRRHHARRRSSRTSTRSSAISTCTPCGDDALGENNRLFLDEARRCAASRARACAATSTGAAGSGRCVTGCPNAAKQGMNVSVRALGARARARGFYCSCRVERVVVEGGARRASSRARRRERRSASGSVTLRARHGVHRRGEHGADAEPPPPERAARAAPSASTSSRTRATGSAASSTAPVEMAFGATQGAESIDAAQDRPHEARDDRACRPSSRPCASPASARS